MAFLHTKNVKLSGLAACVPGRIEENIGLDLFKDDEAEKFILNTGVERRRIIGSDCTLADLCFQAGAKLIKDLQWNREEIDCLIFVTQTPDYILPATSCILQDRLGLSQECYSLDLSLGCSGWVYGTSVISSLLQTGHFRKGLLLVGDTISKITSAKDKSTWPLFGDAGTATAFEYDNDNPGFLFHFATDGSGYKSIIVPDGGFRNQFHAGSLEDHIIEEGISRRNVDIILDGMNVFAFGISKAPESVSKLIENFQLNKDEIDAFVFHQANLFMNEKIRKKLNLPPEKVPYSLKNFGNTSSATIPLTLVTEWSEKLRTEKQKIIACGFGVGLSWGSIFLESEKIICSNLIQL
jgi:3-oxoacyl-[acyl-carrier-protein] synthase III